MSEASPHISKQPGAPRATYRLQLHAGFTFADAAALVPYLCDLGVSHLYLSPILRAAPGSSHGYDVVDPRRIDDDRGGEAGFTELSDACRAHGMGVIIDIVPNHLDISSPENRWWRSTLALGPRSRHADVFDIDWASAASGKLPRVTLPILGETLAEALDERKLSLERSADGWIDLVYYEKRLPVSPETVAGVLRSAAERAANGRALNECADSLEPAGRDPATLDLDELSAPVRTLMDEQPAVAEAVDDALRALVADRDALDDLVEQQHYNPTLWRRESRELNYRRFFDINEMIGTRVDREKVFDALHERIVGLITEGRADGLRVDHPDGLRDPRAYFRRLADRTVGAWIVAEKILEADERLPADWEVAGTTGYDFLNDALGVLLDADAENGLTATYAEFTRAETSFHAVAVDSQRSAARTLLAADLGRLIELLERCAPHDARLAADRSRLSESVALLAASMPVYRTYLTDEDAGATDRDRVNIEQAAAEASRLRPDLSPTPLNAVVDALLLRTPGAPRAAREFAIRFQQYSSPVMAKGVEDTSFYRYNRLIALNEVGGDPARFGVSPESFHARCARRAAQWPSAMVTTATHDTKRSEDVRARLAVLTECPDAWAKLVAELHAINERRSPELIATVDENAAYLLYQTLVGAWPISADRAVEFMRKAAREAKTRTSWRQPDETYEQALESLVRSALDDQQFVERLSAFVDVVERPGRINSITQALLRLTSPGVPDTYQGTELWDYSLVDPDNRRPVDFEIRRRLVDRVRATTTTEVWRTLDDADDLGVTKLLTIVRALEARARFPEAFDASAGYEPLAVLGRHRDRVIAYARNDARHHSRVCVVVPRLTTDAPDWADTAVKLPAISSASGGRVTPPTWRNVLAGNGAAPGPAALSDLFAESPVALLLESSSEAPNA
jgi:(1->4)-alpha-D-glucan 1-alpha-D-glucosylmutase